MRVWITRSQPGAARHAAALADHGHQAVVAPVISIREIPGPPPTGAFSDLIFLSEHAVRLGVERLVTAGFDLTSLRVVAVGPSTAALLDEMGITALTPPVASSEGLLAMPEFAPPLRRDVLIVAGLGGRDLLVAELRSRGARVEKYAVYERQAVDRIDADLAGVQAIAVGSGDGFDCMARLWFVAGGSDEVPVFVPSQRIAELGGKLGFRNVYVCRGASAQALLDGLKALTIDE